MKSLILFCILSIAKSGGSIDTRDSYSSEKQKDFINNGVVNTFAGLPAGTVKSQEPKLETLLEISDSNRYVTLAFFNISWWDGDEEKFKEDDHERAKYGMGQVMNISGQLVHISSADDINDHTACNTSLRDSFGNLLSKYSQAPWIALIKRGGCDFEKKILHVFHQKAAGAIIYNNHSGSELNYMKITNKELLEGNISSVFTPMYKGNQLAEIIRSYGETRPVHISIRQGMKFDKKSNFGHRSSVLFVTISFIIVMVISMLWLIVYYYQRFRYLQTKENEQKMDTNKAKEALKKIPTKTIKTLSKEIESDCCAVCIEAYRLNDILRCLPCKHEFHRNCIDPWLLQNYTCPLCKCRVLKQYGFVITGSQESIIQLELDDEEEEITPHQRRRYSVSPMPQMQRSSESQTSGRSTPESPVDACPIPPVGIILIHKPCGECSTAEDKKANEENFARYATYPIVRGKCLVANKCTCDLDNVTPPPPQNIHQTLDFPKSKKHTKRPTILFKSDCDQNDSNSDINSSDAKN